MMKRFLLGALMCLQTVIASADILKLRVVDSEDGEPLSGAQVQLMMAEGNSYYMYDATTDSCGVLTENTGNFMRRVSIVVNYFGYEEQKVKEFVAMGGKDTLDLGDLKMKMSAALLKEVTIKGKAKQFYMKGDTVVFNPEAFNLEDGARVSELVKRLPGVRVEDGKLTFNGKEVHLKMNGLDMTDDFLAAQLPAEAVQNIKAYEKKSEKTELTGMNDGQEKQVLDIVIKPGFMDKWYGQTSASAYASKNYRASANMHYLSDKNPMGVYGRVSDNGTRTGAVWDNGDWDNENGVPQRQQYGKFSYKHNWRVENAESSYDTDSWYVNTTPSHLDSHQNIWNNTENFLTGQASSYSNSHSYNYNHGLDLPVALGTSVHFSPRTMMSWDVRGGMSKERSRGSSDQETYQADQYADAPQSLVNSSQSERYGHSDKGFVTSSMYLIHAWKKSDLTTDVRLEYNRNRGNADNHTEYDYRTLGTRETLDQSTQSWSNDMTVTSDINYSMQVVPEKLTVGAGFWFYGLYNTDQSDMLSNGVYDLTNSYDRKKGVAMSEPRVDVSVDLGKLWMAATVKMANSDERLDYQRGKLDTLIHHNTWFPRPRFEMKVKTTKTTELKANIDWDHHTADLLESSAYIDDTNPLLVTMGNPNLRGTSDLKADLSYNMMFVRGQQMLTWRMNYSRAFDPVASASAYDVQTGGYTSTRVNVNDRERWWARLQYDRALGQYFRLRSSVNYLHTRDHGVKNRTALDLPMEQYAQRISDVDGDLRISFENNGWEVAANGYGDYNGVTYSDPTLSGQHLWNYRAGLEGKYKMQHWTFELKGNLKGNAGYLSDIMNRNRFCLDASITWKMLKNKGLLKLSAKDLLNQMDQVYYNISPTMRSETRDETFHRYVALTFTYNIDAKAKKK